MKWVDEADGSQTCGPYTVRTRDGREWAMYEGDLISEAVDSLHDAKLTCEVHFQARLIVLADVLSWPLARVTVLRGIDDEQLHTVLRELSRKLLEAGGC